MSQIHPQIDGRAHVGLTGRGSLAGMPRTVARVPPRDPPWALSKVTGRGEGGLKVEWEPGSPSCREKPPKGGWPVVKGGRVLRSSERLVVK